MEIECDLELPSSIFGKNHPCVYVLMDGDDVVYIGKTKRPSDRFNTHERGSKVFDRIRIIFTDDNTLLERELIRMYKPKYNKRVL